jgi:hypothetical protein
VLHELRTRLLARDRDAWNHARRAVILTPILILAGGAASILLQSELAHRGYTVGPDGVVTLVVVVASLVVGYDLFARLGRRHPRGWP